jgi:hypothetical protein
MLSRQLVLWVTISSVSICTALMMVMYLVFPSRTEPPHDVSFIEFVVFELVGGIYYGAFLTACNLCGIISVRLATRCITRSRRRAKASS